MNPRALLCCAAMLIPAAAPAVTTYRADLAPINSSGVSGFINFTLDGNLLNVDLEARGLSDLGVHYIHIHGLDAAPGQPIDTVPPAPPVPPNGDIDRNNALTTGEAKAAIGNVILSLAPHAPGVSAELDGVASTNGALSFIGSYDLTQNIYEPGYTEADLLPLDFRVFDMHGGIVPANTVQNGTTLAPGTFDPNLPIAAGAIALVGTTGPGTGAVPEPATWAMFIGGFGLIGTAMRRRGRIAVRFG